MAERDPFNASTPTSQTEPQQERINLDSDGPLRMPRQNDPTIGRGGFSSSENEIALAAGRRLLLRNNSNREEFRPRFSEPFKNSNGPDEYNILEFGRIEPNPEVVDYLEEKLSNEMNRLQTQEIIQRESEPIDQNPNNKKRRGILSSLKTALTANMASRPTPNNVIMRRTFTVAPPTPSPTTTPVDIPAVTLPSVVFQEISEKPPYAEKVASEYRAGRLQSPHFREVFEKIRQNPVTHSRIKAFAKIKERLLDGTRKKGEHHRNLTPMLAAIMSDAETGRSFMRAVDATVREESDALKAEALSGPIKADIVIAGYGLHGTIAAATLRSELPDARIIIVDANDRPGGQFRSYGERPVLSINSRAHRRQDNRLKSLPGQNGNLNPFGPQAPMQATDLSTETYTTNLDLGNTAAVNGILSAEGMVGVELIDRTDAEDGETITVRDKNTGQEIIIDAEFFIGAAGAGERAEKEKSNKILSYEDFLSIFGDETNPFPMDQFIGKTIAVKGGGDSGRTVNEILARLAPKEAYGSSLVQLGGPERVYWYGTDFTNREEYCKTNRGRYGQLSSFIYDPNEPQYSNRFQIIPTKAKIEDTFDSSIGDQVCVIGTDIDLQYVDYVIDAGPLRSDFVDEFSNELAGNLITGALESGIEAFVGRQLSRRAFAVGPSAKLPLARSEQRAFADGIKENTIALWKDSPRTVTMAQDIAKRYRYLRK